MAKPAAYGTCRLTDGARNAVRLELVLIACNLCRHERFMKSRGLHYSSRIVEVSSTSSEVGGYRLLVGPKYEHHYKSRREKR
jgi:hypothetical protein